MTSVRIDPVVTLNAENLLYKYGFSDAEEPDAVWGRRIPDPWKPDLFEWPGGWDAMLVALVREHLLPLVPVPIEVFDLPSHNPIRASKVDGVPEPEHPRDLWPERIRQLLRNVEVTVTWQQLLAARPAAERVAEEWRARWAR